MSDEALRYLATPSGYSRHFGGLHWSKSGDELQTSSGQLFIFTRQLSLFFEGYLSVSPPLHMAHMLHLLHLLGLGPLQDSPEGASELRRAFWKAGKPLRNAGVLCAVLCGEFPHSSISVTLDDLRAMLERGGPGLADRQANTRIETPPLEFAEFQARFLDALAKFTPEELEHWLTFGCGPDDTGKKLAEEIAARPPSLLEVMEAASRDRERLTGALALVSSLSGALSLPPRRLDQHELPVGGYADVTTRGSPERLLPSQYALDGVEFVRRFAENELLYFRREEPNNPAREELIIVVDQGVRTWGGVRLALTGAVMAFAKLAARKKITFRLATTGNGGKPIDPIELGAAKVGDLLEASDLSPHPAMALEKMLASESEPARDIVLLTHPRSLNEEEVAAATRLHQPNDRLFTVSVDSEGVGQLAQLRQGVPLPISRFRVDLVEALKPARSIQPRARAPLQSPGMWTGAVEPIPFPFWFGPVGRVQHIALDARNEWLLATGPHGLLHALKLDGSQMEVWPRGYMANQVLQRIDAVLGVADGFVVAGRMPLAAANSAEQFVAFHYRFAERTVKVYQLGLCQGVPPAWFYFPTLHSIAVGNASNVRAVDLETAGQFPFSGYRPELVTRARAACSMVDGIHRPTAETPVVRAGIQPQLEYKFHSETGAFELRTADTPWPAAIPQSDGKPLLAGAILRDVQCAGSTLAISASLRTAPHTQVFVFRGPTCTPVATLPIFRDLNMRLSNDGHFIAVPTNSNEVTVYSTSGGQPPVIVLPPGRIHSRLDVALGDQSLLVSVGKTQHLFRWDRGLLVHRFAKNPGWNLSDPTAAATTRVQSTCYDPARFQVVVHENLRLLVDAYGNLIFQNARSETLLAALTVRKGRAAGWLWDGTRWGDATIHGPESPNAAERIGKALRDG
ncbi:MAG TPA: hypothetical protein VKS79_14605 [Gemmataceae bacterium]|nr:hypothetical protein [Gemmataceae bacterium]